MSNIKVRVHAASLSSTALAAFSCPTVKNCFGLCSAPHSTLQKQRQLRPASRPPAAKPRAAGSSTGTALPSSPLPSPHLPLHALRLLRCGRRLRGLRAQRAQRALPLLHCGGCRLQLGLEHGGLGLRGGGGQRGSEHFRFALA